MNKTMGKLAFAFGMEWIKNTFLFSAVLLQIADSLDTESFVDSLKGWILFALSSTFIIIKICKELKNRTK